MRLLPASWPPRVLLCMGVLLACGTLSAQTLTVRLLNANSGKPLANKNITLQWGDGPAKAIVPIDRDGVGHVTIPPGTTTFIVISGPNTGPDPHRVAYADCNANSLTEVKVADAVTHGVVPTNICGKRRMQPVPGEVVFWASPHSGGFLGMQ